MDRTAQSSIQNAPSISPATQAVVTQALLAAANEVGAKLIRSAHSPIVREASDCSTALLDRHGNVVAQAELIPLQLGSISHTFGLNFDPMNALKHQAGKIDEEVDKDIREKL